MSCTEALGFIAASKTPFSGTLVRSAITAPATDTGFPRGELCIGSGVRCLRPRLLAVEGAGEPRREPEDDKGAGVVARDDDGVAVGVGVGVILPPSFPPLPLASTAETFRQGMR